MPEEFPLVSKIVAQSFERTAEILNAILSSPTTEEAETVTHSAIGTVAQSGMTALVLVCAAIGTVGLLKLIQKFFEDGRGK